MRQIAKLTLRAFKVVLPVLMASFMAILGYLAYPVLNPWLTDKFLRGFWIEPFEVHDTNLNMKLVDRIDTKPCRAEQKAEISKSDFLRLVPGVGMPRAVRTFRIAPDGRTVDENQPVNNTVSQEN